MKEDVCRDVKIPKEWKQGGDSTNTVGQRRTQNKPLLYNPT